MSSRRMHTLLLGLIGLLLLALLGGTYGINQLLHTKTQRLVALKLQNQMLNGQQAGLTKAKKEVQTYSSLNDIAKTIVPQDKDQAKAVREISNLAQASGIQQLSSVSFPQSTLGGIGGTSSSSATASSSTGNSKSLTQLTPVKGIAGLYALQITIQQSVGDNPVLYSQFLTFLEKLEQNRRTAQVSSVTITPDTNNPQLIGFSLIINEFIRP